MGNIKGVIIGVFVFLALPCISLMAQRDSTYYISYRDKITGRFYFSKKYTAFNLRNAKEDLSLSYQPNTTVNMGVGATYKWATLNLAYGFDFLNPDRGRGDTDYLDLQVHAYGRRFTFDFIGQLYEGFFLSPKGMATNNNSYYLRPDMKVLTTGISAQYVLNHDKYSYQAAFHQSEWQKKSAGSLLFGFETYLGSIRGDSVLVPSAVENSLTVEGTDRIVFFELGPNIGYAYSFIIMEHFFITASATVSLDYGKTVLRSDIEKDEEFSGFSPNLFLRGFCGYNSDLWGVSFVYINNAVNLSASDGIGRRFTLNTGNFRLNIIRRFSPGRKAGKVLKYIDGIKSVF